MKNIINIENDRIYALVVGIESYGEPKWNNLRGPVNDALNFARWLLDIGVNKQNIFLHLSSCGDSPENVGLDVRGASKNEINDVIDNTLLSSNSSGDLLYIFWSGHGFMTTSGQQGSRRRLFYSDSNFGTPINLDVTSLLNALRSFTRGSGFHFEFCFVDACSNLIFQERWDIERAIILSDQKAPNGEQQHSNQAALFAAPLYGVTGNNNREGIGLFSKVLFKQLKELSQNDILIDPQFLITEIRNQLSGNLSSETYGRIFSGIKNEIPQISNFHEPCVDREKIVKTFEGMISGEVKKNILLLEGHSNFGKTWLLDNRFKDKIPNSMLSVKSELIGVNESIEYVFSRIINKLEESVRKFGSSKKFKKFRKVLKEYFPSLNDNEPIKIEKIKECLQVKREKRIDIISCFLKAFCNDLSDITNHKIHNEQKKIILLFDSLNNLDTEVARFLLIDFLEEIYKLPKVVVVICGQSNLNPCGQANLNPYSSDVRSNCKYFNLCEVDNLIDIPSWQRFVKEYQGLGGLGSSYELIEPNDTEMVVKVLQNEYSELLTPVKVMTHLTKWNEGKKANTMKK